MVLYLRERWFENDEELKNKETKDYLRRVEAELEGYRMEGFFDKQYHLGTLAILHNTDKDPQTVSNIRHAGKWKK